MKRLGHTRESYDNKTHEKWWVKLVHLIMKFAFTKEGYFYPISGLSSRVMIPEIFIVIF